MLITALKLVGAGACVSGLAGVGIGMGLIFSAYIKGLSKNPKLKGELFSALILGFALVESVALFCLLMAFLILFAF